MPINDEFTFEPLPPIENPIHFPFPKLPNPLGPLSALTGTWGGTKMGFNTIWRPFNGSSDHFLELNLTDESIAFTAIGGPIPNRGLLQADINMFGLTYLQQISDANLNAGLHIEPGIWAVAPLTSNPAEQPTVIRMGSIPHGTTILAQGVATTAPGPPNIPNNNILPFIIGNPSATFNFQEQDLSLPSTFRSPAAQLVGITQSMVDNPNSVLQAVIAGQTIISTTTLQVSTSPALPIVGGGTANTAFLSGNANGPNALSAVVSATFWIETLQGQQNATQLQYSQTVILNFNGLSWPHVTVGTLKLDVPIVIPPWKIDTTLPVGFKPGDIIPPRQPVIPVVPPDPERPA